MDEYGRTDLDDQPVVEVDISSLSVRDSPRTSGENPDHVEALAATDAELPPIIVNRSTMSVIDGVHRLRVAQRRGQRTIGARLFDGNAADAFVLAVRSNITHGLPLSVADRKHAAGRIIASHPQWSDRMIASVSGISPGTVAEVRRHVTREPAPGDIRVGQDGRMRPVDATEGRRLASQLITDNPSLSLRQVAKRAGISPETVRDVRNRLRQGEDPLPMRQRRNTRPPDSEKSAPALQEAPPGGRALSRSSTNARSATIERLKADPALRLTETGRVLLRLLSLHTVDEDTWQSIVSNLPPHCTETVAQLSRECAEVWAEFAMQVERRANEMAYTA